jgi:integral membrane sensor domain MASE1
MEEKSVKFDRYGTLITVASLLFIVIYATDAYDGWDLIVSMIGATFGIKYLQEKVYFDFFSSFLGFLIATTGIVFTIVSIVEIIYPGVTEPIKGPIPNLNITLIIICFLSLFLGYSKTKKV